MPTERQFTWYQVLSKCLNTGLLASEFKVFKLILPSISICTSWIHLTWTWRSSSLSLGQWTASLYESIALCIIATLTRGPGSSILSTRQFTFLRDCVHLFIDSQTSISNSSVIWFPKLMRGCWIITMTQSNHHLVPEVFLQFGSMVDTYIRQDVCQAWFMTRMSTICTVWDNVVSSSAMQECWSLFSSELAPHYEPSCSNYWNKVDILSCSPHSCCIALNHL